MTEYWGWNDTADATLKTRVRAKTNEQRQTEALESIAASLKRLAEQNSKALR